jgi:hypothetical protein
VTAWRQVLELSIGDEDLARLTAIARSRTEPASRVERARMLLAYREDPSFFAAGRALGMHHQTVQRCVERAVAYGLDVRFLETDCLHRDGRLLARSRPVVNARKSAIPIYQPPFP